MVGMELLCTIRIGSKSREDGAVDFLVRSMNCLDAKIYLVAWPKGNHNIWSRTKIWTNLAAVGAHKRGMGGLLTLENELLWTVCCEYESNVNIEVED